MKNRILVLALSLCTIALFACAFMPASAQVETPAEQAVGNKALIARFTNMLNRNYSYNDNFEDAEILTDNAIIALLDKRDGTDPDYISEEIVKNFVNDMYDIGVLEINDNSTMHKDGFVYIDPIGFTTYHHTVTNINENEDGSFTVLSDVTVNPHDSDEYKTTAKTLFVQNSDSSFGYNIIYSDLDEIQNGI
ncbi:MAG: hypothetical protein J5659_01315 [Clostridia bacterium]|nr:hypothetical protein [Clostridia bacterium]